jgi:hypothetical protein
MSYLKFDYEDYMKWLKTQKRPLISGEGCFWFDEQYSIDKNLKPEQVYFTAPTATIHPVKKEDIEIARKVLGGGDEVRR